MAHPNDRESSSASSTSRSRRRGERLIVGLVGACALAWSASLLRPGAFGASDRASEGSARAVSALPRARRASAAVPSQSTTAQSRAPAPAVHVWSTRDDGERIAVPAGAAARADAASDWHGMAVELSAEEQAILDQHPLEDLGLLTAQAEDAYRKASDAERPEAQRRYDLLLNLGAKVIVYERPEPSPELLHAQDRYLAALNAAQRDGKTLSEAQRSKLKDSFLASVVEHDDAMAQPMGNAP